MSFSSFVNPENVTKLTASIQIFQKMPGNGAGVFFVGDQETIDEIAKAANDICRKQHDRRNIYDTLKNHFANDQQAAKAFEYANECWFFKKGHCESGDECLFRHTQNGSVVNHPMLNREQRDKFYSSIQVTDSVMAHLEFIHIKSVHMGVPPAEVMIDQETRNYIFQQQERYLRETVFAKYLKEKIGVGDVIEKVYPHYSKRASLVNMHYLIGVEPLSINSCLSGYRNCANISMTNGGLEGSSIDTAKKESKEEFHIDVDEMFSNKQYRDLLKEKDIGFEENIKVNSSETHIFICLCLKDYIEVCQEEDVVILKWKEKGRPEEKEEDVASLTSKFDSCLNVTQQQQ